MKVDHLSKVTIDLSAGHSEEKMDLIPEPVSWSFVTGVSAEGLAPFEMACLQKSPGDEVYLEIPAQQPLKIFEHLRPPILGELRDQGTVGLKAVVTAVATASSREVVQAMAEATSHGGGGCGGDCGCGCG